MTSVAEILITPRKPEKINKRRFFAKHRGNTPWSRFLYFLLSKTWMVIMDDVRTLLAMRLAGSRMKRGTYKSKDSFHAGLSVLRATDVEHARSPSTATIAKGSGRLKSSRFARPVAPVTARRSAELINKERKRTGQLNDVLGVAASVSAPSRTASSHTYPLLAIGLDPRLDLGSTLCC